MNDHGLYERSSLGSIKAKLIAEDAPVIVLGQSSEHRQEDPLMNQTLSRSPEAPMHSQHLLFPALSCHSLSLPSAQYLIGYSRVKSRVNHRRRCCGCR